MGKREAEFGEFFGVAWPRIYRTTYAVVGEHPITQSALTRAFASAYADWWELSPSADLELEVAGRAINEALAALEANPVSAQGSHSAPGPFLPYGVLIRATPAERAEIDGLWAELQRLTPMERVEIALAAAARSSSPESPRSVDPNDVRQSRLVEFVARILGELVVSDGDVNRVIAAGKTRQRRRRWLTLSVAIVVIAVVAVSVARWSAKQETGAPIRLEGSWREVAAAPLSPRWDALALWTGEKVLVFGGLSEATCDERGQCAQLRDAALYDPQDDSWRKAADVPFDAAKAGERAGNQLYVLGDEHWWLYDPAADAWTRLPDPPEFRPDARLSVAASGSALYTVGAGAEDPVRVFDPGVQTWSTLRPSPHKPGLDRRQLVDTPAGLVVLGASSDGPPTDPFDLPEVYGEIFDGTSWTRLPRSFQSANSCCWWWSGERIIHTERLPVYAVPATAKGVRFSGGMFFDLATQNWGFIREAPTDPLVESALLYAEEGPQVAFGHLIYDDRDKSWTRLPAPAQAPTKLTAAAWADGKLFAFGGANLDSGLNAHTDATNRAWIYSPAPRKAD